MFDSFASQVLWLLNISAFFSVMLLSHGRINTGRILGVLVSVGWCVFGISTGYYSFLFVNFLYLVMYCHAIYRKSEKTTKDIDTGTNSAPV